MTVALPQPLRSRRPPPPTPSMARRLREWMAEAPVQAVVTAAVAVLLAWALARLLRWGILDAVFWAGSPAACRQAAGACWALLTSQARVIAFGLYPPDQVWRPGAALALAALPAAVAIGWPRIGLRALGAIAFIGLGSAIALMAGGFAGLPRVTIDKWGGLPLTLLVFAGTVAAGFPMAVLLALARGARWPLLRVAAGGVVEFVRAVPLLTVLFCAAVVMPMVVPGWLNPDKIWRVVFALALFFACYQAEVIRGALQGVPSGQGDAAASLGLRPRQTIWLVVLPQALRIALPATLNLLVVAFKDTAMVITVGLFDFLATANTAITNDAWAPYFVELYLFVSAVYLLGTGALTLWGARLEARMADRA